MTAVLTPATTRPAPPSALSVGLARTALELRLFVRDRRRSSSPSPTRS